MRRFYARRIRSIIARLTAVCFTTAIIYYNKTHILLPPMRPICRLERACARRDDSLMNINTHGEHTQCVTPVLAVAVDARNIYNQEVTFLYQRLTRYQFKRMNM